MSKKIQSKYNAPALDKGLDILEHLSEVGIPLTQIEIAHGIDKSPSEIYRMLVRLEERGYIIRGSNAGKYRLSLKMYSLSHRHTPFDELKRVAQYPMQALSEATRQSCHLSVIDRGQLLVISQVRSPGAVSLSIEEGTHFPLSMTTSGIVFLSILSKKKRKDILDRDMYYNRWSKKERQEFEKQLEQISGQGYYLSNSKLTNGVTDISVSIGLESSKLMGVLAISMLASNLEEETEAQEILEAIKKTQQEINKLIGA